MIWQDWGQLARSRGLTTRTLVAAEATNQARVTGGIAWNHCSISAMAAAWGFGSRWECNVVNVDLHASVEM